MTLTFNQGGMSDDKDRIKKCEKAMIWGIVSGNQAKVDYDSYEKLRKVKDCEVTAEVRLRSADQHLGYAQGINQTLVTIGLKHDRMSELCDLI